MLRTHRTAANLFHLTASNASPTSPHQVACMETRLAASSRYMLALKIKSLPLHARCRRPFFLAHVRPGFGAALFEGTVSVTVQLSARRNARLLPFSSRRRLIS